MRSLKQSRDRELSRMAKKDRLLSQRLLGWKAWEHAYKNRRPVLPRGQEVADLFARVEARLGHPLPYSVAAGQGGVVGLERHIQ